jgi:hypothetical protein
VFPVVTVTRQDSTPERPVAAAGPTVGQPRFIDLSIRGEELLLSGKFEHWVPLALESGGKRSQAQLVFDVTSPGPANDTGGELFSFVSSKVRRVADGTYLAQGTMQHGDVQRATKATVQAPAAHSPFAVVTFEVAETDFPEVWEELSTRVSAQNGSSADVRPRAWLLTPVIAAA